MNSTYADAREPRDFFIPPGSVLIKLTFLPESDRAFYSPDRLVEDCETAQDPEVSPGAAQSTVIDDRPVTVCVGSELQPTGGLMPYVVQWIDLASGRTLKISALRFEPSSVEDAVTETILGTIQLAEQ